MATKEDKQTGLISNTLNKASEKLVKSDNEKRLKVSTCSANIGRTKYEKKKKRQGSMTLLVQTDVNLLVTLTFQKNQASLPRVCLRVDSFL